MLIQATNTIGLSVASLEEQEKIGKVREIIVDGKNAKILGFVAKVGLSIFGKKMFLAPIDILDIDKNGLVIKNTDSILEPTEIIRVKQIMDEGFDLFGLKAYDEEKNYLGKIFDFVIEYPTFSITKYYVRSIMTDRIFDSKNVLEITNKAIIFKLDGKSGSRKVLTQPNSV